MKVEAAKPKTPSRGIAAMIAMGATQDEELAAEVFHSLLKEARDQDIVHYFFGFSSNHKLRNYAMGKFQESYDWVRWTPAQNVLLISRPTSWRNALQAIGPFRPFFE